MSERKNIRTYLLTLNRYLAPLSDDEAREVVKEIESHIYDVIDECEVTGNEPDVDAILARFGPPRTLAEKYVSHIRSGTPPPEGFNAISSIRKGLSVTSFYGLSLFGYGISIALIALGFANLLVPDGIAIWSEANGNSIVIGFLGHPALKHHDAMLQGFWITPATLVIGYLIMRMTHKILRFIKQASVGQRYV